MTTEADPESPTKNSFQKRSSLSHDAVERERQRGISPDLWPERVHDFSFSLRHSKAASISYYYKTYAVSEFENHGELLGIIFTVTPMIQAVSQPFIAKICDVWSRQMGFTLSTLLLVIGFVIMPTAQNGYAFAASSVIGAVGTQGIGLCTTILLADISSLQWYSFANSMASLWYIVTPWIGANIANQAGLGNWRWGYGMFTIINHFSMALIIGTLFWGEFRAISTGVLKATLERQP